MSLQTTQNHPPCISYICSCDCMAHLCSEDVHESEIAQHDIISEMCASMVIFG